MSHIPKFTLAEFHKQYTSPLDLLWPLCFRKEFNKLAVVRSVLYQFKKLHICLWRGRQENMTDSVLHICSTPSQQVPLYTTV